VVAGREDGDGRQHRMRDRHRTDPPGGRDRPQRHAAPDRPRHVQRRHGGVEVGLRRLEVVRRRQVHAHRVLEARQHPRRRDRIEPVDTQADQAGQEQRVAMPSVAVAEHPQQQQRQRRHAEVHDEVVRRQQLGEQRVTAEPVVHRLGPGDVQQPVQMQHRTPVREAGADDVAVHRPDLVVADREADDEQHLHRPLRSAAGERRELHALHPANWRAGPAGIRSAPRGRP
jgi:hypothetical protein